MFRRHGSLKKSETFLSFQFTSRFAARDASFPPLSHH
jgi:hypothetical protein